jgi:polysaccharide export outer membrane protein
MTIKSTPILKTLVLAGLVLAPAAADAQGSRSTPSATTAPRAAAPARTTIASSVPNVRPWNDEEYRLGPGDKLRVEVYRETQLSQSLQVRPDGKITLPLIGDVSAAGRTSMELRDVLTTSLKEYVTNPVVTVIVQEATAAQVYVIGEVPNTGAQVMQGPITVLQALAHAGGLREFADGDGIRILRRSGADTITIPFKYKDAIRGRTEPFYLQPGDTIVVP